MTVNTGGSASYSNGTWIGFNAGSSGTLTIAGGTYSTANGTQIGGSGTGVFTMTGGTASTATTRVGYNAGSNGTATISGGTWTAAYLYIAEAGTGVVTMDGGLVIVERDLTRGSSGTLNLNAGGTLQIGNGVVGGVLLGGTGDLLNNGTLIYNSPTNRTYSGAMSGIGAFVKQGTNTLTLSGNNSYDGGTTLNGGTLSLGSANAIGTSGPVTFGGGTLQYSASNSSDNSARFSNAASQQYSIDTNSQNVTLASNLTSTGGSFTKIGAGTLTLTGNNSYDGGTTLLGGTLSLGSANAIGTSGTVTFAGGTLQYSASNSSDNSASFSNAPSQQYSIDTNNQSVTLATALTSDGGSFTKLGDGTLTLTGTNTYTGATTVSAGQLVVNGSSSGSAHTVGNGGTLGGTGTVGTLLVQNGGTISPGNSPGILNVSGNTTWLDGGNYNWQLLDATGAAGAGWDQLAITGALDLASLTAGGFNVNVWSLSSALVNGNAQNFDGIGGIYSWPIATASGGITGFDAGDFTIFTGSNNGTTGFTNDFTGGTFSMSQTGNNLYLNYLGPTPVPEPANAVTVLALFSGAVLQRRKRVVKH